MTQQKEQPMPAPRTDVATHQLYQGRHERFEVPRPEWLVFFRHVSRDHAGDDVTIEALDLRYGDTHRVERMPLFDLEYDIRDDVVITSVGGRDNRYPVVLRHVIPHPQRVLADPSVPGAHYVLNIASGEGTWTIVSLYPHEDS